MPNFDSSAVGVPYVRAHRIVIHYPEPGSNNTPWARIEQSEAVKLADGTVRRLSDIETLERQFDMNDLTPIPLVHPETGAPLGQSVTLQQVMLSILAVVRHEQKREVSA